MKIKYNSNDHTAKIIYYELLTTNYTINDLYEFLYRVLEFYVTGVRIPAWTQSKMVTHYKKHLRFLKKYTTKPIPYPDV